MLRKTARAVYVFFGLTFLMTGIVGILVPLLPTTPFLILAAFCFSRGSDKFYRWLLAHRWFGKPIIDWQRNQSIHLKYKILATSMMLISVYYMISNERIPQMALTVAIFFIFCVLVFLWTRKNAS